MKLSSEAKLGITGILTLAVVIWGINYLKGINILSNTYTLWAEYERIEGLEEAAEVILYGYKIGNVEEIQFDAEAAIPFRVKLAIEKKYKLKKGSIAEIYSSDLLGSRAVRILPGEGPDILKDKDLIPDKLADDPLDKVLKELDPMIEKLSSIIINIDSAGQSINRLFSKPELDQSIENIEATTAFLKQLSSEEGSLGKISKNLETISDSLEASSGSINSSIRNVESISNSLADAKLDSMILTLHKASENIALISESLQQGKGSAGKLLNEDSLYQNLDKLVADLDSLIIDINENPKKYLNFSVFGK